MSVDIQGDGAAAGLGEFDCILDGGFGPSVRDFAGAVGLDGDRKAMLSGIPGQREIAPDRSMKCLPPINPR